MTKQIFEFLPHVPHAWLTLCERAVNVSANKPDDSTPMFKSKRHVLAEICAANALMFIEDYLSPKEREFCYDVYQYMEDNIKDRDNWSIKHIVLEDDKPSGIVPTDMSEMIDEKVKSGQGLVLGDRLKLDTHGFHAEMKVVGFDSKGCPFVKYTKIRYQESAKPSGEKEGDELQAGDIMPFPWSNPKQYKLDAKTKDTTGN